MQYRLAERSGKPCPPNPGLGSSLYDRSTSSSMAAICSGLPSVWLDRVASYAGEWLQSAVLPRARSRLPGSLRALVRRQQDKNRAVVICHRLQGLADKGTRAVIRPGPAQAGPSPKRQEIRPGPLPVPWTRRRQGATNRRTETGDTCRGCWDRARAHRPAQPIPRPRPIRQRRRNPIGTPRHGSSHLQRRSLQRRRERG